VAKVRLKATLTIGARNYLAGDVVELTEEQAKVLVDRDLAELVEEKIDLAEKKPKKKGGK
jgi:uncharacterized membrane protein